MREKDHGVEMSFLLIGDGIEEEIICGYSRGSADGSEGKMGEGPKKSAQYVANKIIAIVRKHFEKNSKLKSKSLGFELEAAPIADNGAEYRLGKIKGPEGSSVNSVQKVTRGYESTLRFIPNAIRRLAMVIGERDYVEFDFDDFNISSGKSLSFSVTYSDTRVLWHDR